MEYCAHTIIVVPGTAANTGNALWVIWVPFESVVVLDGGFEKLFEQGWVWLADEVKVEEDDPLAVVELSFCVESRIRPAAPATTITTTTMAATAVPIPILQPLLFKSNYEWKATSIYTYS